MKAAVKKKNPLDIKFHKSLFYECAKSYKTLISAGRLSGIIVLRRSSLPSEIACSLIPAFKLNHGHSFFQAREAALQGLSFFLQRVPFDWNK